MHSPTRHLLIATMLLPTVLGAQGVVVQSVSNVRFYGSFGTVVNFAARLGGANMHDVQTTTSIAGHKMKVESENSATIIDADAGRFTSIDQKQKTYTSFTFDEMATAMQQATQSMQTARQNAQATKPAEAKDPKARTDSVSVNYTVAVDRPGEHAKIAGYDAERVFLTITLTAEATPEGQKTQDVGSLVFLIDQWRSTNAPQIAALQEFQRAYMQKVGQTFRPTVEGLQSAFSADPRIKTGFEAAGKELAKVPGVALRSVTYVVGVPAGMTFDRKLVLNDASAAATADSAKKDEAPKSGGGGFRGLMGALKSAADNANKKPADDKSSPQLKQGTMMSVNDEATTITRGAVPPGTFDVPAGYREIKMRMPTSPE
ncbi:MAG: hypothetical protein ACREPM_11680 [Gemmatimonadaceae bacterium]